MKYSYSELISCILTFDLVAITMKNYCKQYGIYIVVYGSEPLIKMIESKTGHSFVLINGDEYGGEYIVQDINM